MNQLLCSTGALIGRPNGRNYRLLKDFAKYLRCDGFEFMMYDTWYGEVDRLEAFLSSLRLNVPVMHCEKRIGEGISRGGTEADEAIRLFEVNARLACSLGASKLVMHLWDGKTSDGFFSNNLRAYERLNRVASAFNLDLLIENVVCAYKNPMERWIELRREYPNVHFVYDTKMAAFHAQTELLYLPEYDWLWKEGRLRHFHVNDYAGGYMDWGCLRTLPVGRGHIDFQRFFEFLRAIRYDGALTVESTAFNERGVVDVDMLNVEIARIHSALDAENVAPQRL